MALSYIWVGFFLVALVLGLVRLVFFGDTAIFTNIVNSTFDMSKTAFEIALGLTGSRKQRVCRTCNLTHKTAIYGRFMNQITTF